MELLLVRHGESVADRHGVCQGRIDFPLSPVGRQQAARVGRALHGSPLAAVYTSPLVRAFETAEIAADEAGFKGRVTPFEEFTERYWGLIEGLNQDQQKQRYARLIQSFRTTEGPGRWTILEAESDAAVAGRVFQALRIIRDQVEKHGGRAVIFSHGSPLRILLGQLIPELSHLPTSGPRQLSLPKASITRLALSGTQAHLRSLAATDHLN